VEATAVSPSRFKQFLALTKPRVTALAVFTAIIGMYLAVPAPDTPPLLKVLLAAVGIWLLAASAFTVNCLLEAHVDSRMKRTSWRGSASGAITQTESILFAFVLGALGSGILCAWVNVLTMLLTLLTFFGYAFIYTLWLKPSTPQNIVIGGASGAMPPVLGWAAATNDVGPMAWVLVLIIFLWTPPHFWALALYRIEDYKKSGLPMLPVTHGSEFTRLHMVLYTVLTVAATMLPVAIGGSGWFYGTCALALGTTFLYYVIALRRRYSDALARKTFKFSILYLMLLFAALLVDHYMR
jgi:protoheme IX farnesyltransferase